MSTTSARSPRTVPSPPAPVPATSSATESLLPDDTAPSHVPTAPRGPSDTKDLKDLPVRALLAELAAVEDRLRATPSLLTRGQATQVNPAVATLLARQRAIVGQLRSRRVSWSAEQPTRERSAAWPPPPWS